MPYYPVWPGPPVPLWRPRPRRPRADGEIDLARFTPDPADPDGDGLHLGGLPWWVAELPRRWHRCRTQSVYYTANLERCPCGGRRRAVAFTDDDDQAWVGRNSAASQRTDRAYLRARREGQSR